MNRPTQTRRSFLFFSVLFAALAALLGFGVSGTARADSPLKFEIRTDKAGEFRWSLKAGNGENLATSGQGYKKKVDAVAGVERIRKRLDTLSFETYEDAKHEFRWRLKSKNGQTVGSSSEGYKEKASAEHAIDVIRQGAKDAIVEEG